MTTYHLRVLDPGERHGEDGDPIPLEARRDDKIIRHMGRSSPRYRHALERGQTWP